MTESRRIILNVIATYGRSLYTLVIGLFCGRWALMVLGEVDYGLVGLVGGLTAFVSFLNGLLANAVGRFYAVAVGAARKTTVLEGREECRKWFNTALFIHSIVPVTLLIVGYPLGEWAVRHFLTIPVDRIAACLWVWRFTCIACLIGMVNVPFRAMYMAKQEIAELTIYGFVTTTLNVLVLYYMLTHPAVWIVKYSLWTMLLAVSPQLIITWRAVLKYPECRFRREYLVSGFRIREIFKFAFARFWTALSAMIAAQGNSILVNKFLGPAFNASMAIGGTVAGHATTLSSSLSGAFWPAIANKAGEGDENQVRQLSFRVCRIGSVMFLVFAIPLTLEVNEVMRLWLKTPPVFVSVICVTVLVDTVLERMSEGYWMAIMGLGRKVGLYSAWVSVSGFSRFVLAWLAFAFGFGIYGLCISIVLSRLVAVVVRLVLGRLLVTMSIRHWLRRVTMPLSVVTMGAMAAGCLVQVMMPNESFGRVVVTTLVCETTFLPLALRFVCSAEERVFLFEKLKARLRFKRI